MATRASPPIVLTTRHLPGDMDVAVLDTDDQGSLEAPSLTQLLEKENEQGVEGEGRVGEGWGGGTHYVFFVTVAKEGESEFYWLLSGACRPEDTPSTNCPPRAGLCCPGCRSLRVPSPDGSPVSSLSSSASSAVRTG